MPAIKKARLPCLGKGTPGLNAEQAEIQRLKREVDIARQERNILRGAVAFFAKESR